MPVSYGRVRRCPSTSCGAPTRARPGRGSPSWTAGNRRKGGAAENAKSPPWERSNDNDEAAPNGPPTYGPTDWAATQLRFVHDALSQPGPCGRLGGLVGSRGGGRSPTLFLNEGCEAPRTHDKPRLQRRASRAEQGVAAPLDFSLCVQDGSLFATSLLIMWTPTKEDPLRSQDKPPAARG